MIKKKLIRLIPFFILCVAILCSTISCSSQKSVYSAKKAPGYKKERINKPKWSYTKNNKKTKYVIKKYKKKKTPYYYNQ